MAQYYAVERSSEYLAHYGVRGMKWGVRKAIERGSDKKLWRQYKKAHKKLNKLSRDADPSVQRRKEIDYEYSARKARNIGRIGLGATAVGLGVGFGYSPIHRTKYEKLNRAADEVARYPGISGSKKLLEIQDRQADLVRKQEILNRSMEGLSAAGAGAALAGYGAYGVNKMLAKRAKKRQSGYGQKMAALKRDTWKREMKKSFKGTKYENSLNEGDFAKEYYKRNKEKIDKKIERIDAYNKKTHYRRFRQKHD